MKIIRVLHVLGELNCGGAENMVMNLYRNIDKTKIQFDFVIHTSKKCYFEDEVKKLGGKIYRVDRYKGINYFQYKKQWKNIFKTHPEYKIIHGHVRSTASIYLKIAKKYGLCTIAHSHSSSSGKGIKAVIKNILQYKIRFIADFFIGCSKQSAEWLFGKKVLNSNKCMILNNAIDTKKYLYNKEIRKRVRKKLEIKNNKKIIANIGRFSKVKNHKFLIEIYEKLLEIDNNYILLLIGNGELEEKIKKLVKNKNLSKKVIFTGVRNDINELLQAIDILVMPSFYEGLPLTLVEAQAASLPCLITDTITKEVELTNLIYRKKLEQSELEWAEEIIKILNSFNREAKLDSQVDLKNKEYDIDIICKKIEKFYKNLYTNKTEI